MEPVHHVSYAEHYRSSPYAGFPQEHRSGGSSDVAIFRVRQASHDFVDPAVPELVVAAAIETDMTFSWNIGDGWTRPQRVRSGSVHVLPARTEARIRAEGNQDMVFLALPPGLQAEALDVGGARAVDIVRNNTDYFHDAKLVRLLLGVWAGSREASQGAALKVDGLLLAVLGRLLDRAARNVAAPEAPLSPRQVEILDALIDARLDDQLRLAELSAEIGLTQFHFARAFRTATGQSPHQYVLARRVARAQAMIAARGASLAEIAFACGFASQAHMTDVFRNRLGVTPGRYRRDVAG